MENVKSTVSKHNHRILSKTTNATNTSNTTAGAVLEKKCNCRKANECHSESIAWKAALFIKLKSQREITEKLNTTSG
jgi:hypothetical protein